MSDLVPLVAEDTSVADFSINLGVTRAALGDSLNVVMNSSSASIREPMIQRSTGRFGVVQSRPVAKVWYAVGNQGLTIDDQVSGYVISSAAWVLDTGESANAFRGAGVFYHCSSSITWYQDTSSLQLVGAGEYWQPTYGYYIESDVRGERDYLRAEANYRSRLLGVLIDEEVEDGILHLAESILEEMLLRYPVTAPIWIQSVFTRTLAVPGLATGLLKCISRLSYDSLGDVATSLVSSGLQHEDVAVREAAVGAVEHWGGEKLLEVLAGHQEGERWMAGYIDQVLSDFTS